MPTATPRTYGLLAAGAALALLVGLVRSVGRAPSRPRAVPSERRERVEPASMRVALAPVESAPLVTAPTAAAPRLERTRLTGVVLRPEGDPASDARVSFAGTIARCRPDGSFELALDAGFRPGPRDDLLAHEPGYEPALRPALGASLAPWTTQELRLVLGPSTLSLAGTLTTRDGRPLEGWTIELDGRDALADFGLREPTRTDAEGRFVLADVPNGVHVVRAFRERRELAFRSPACAAGETGIAIVADD